MRGSKCGMSPQRNTRKMYGHDHLSCATEKFGKNRFIESTEKPLVKHANMACNVACVERGFRVEQYF